MDPAAVVFWKIKRALREVSRLGLNELGIYVDELDFSLESFNNQDSFQMGGFLVCWKADGRGFLGGWNEKYAAKW